VRIVAQMPSEAQPTLRDVRRLRQLSEAECYARCYRGWEPTVTVVKLEPRRPRYPTSVTGESLRRIFEERIDTRVDGEEFEAA
jgi:hypothetical protein